MSEAVAGRLEIPVESNTKGFGERLQAAIDKEVRNVAAKIAVEIDSTGLKAKLEAAVEEAQRGVTAKIGVDVDSKLLKEKLTAAAKAAGDGTKVKIGVDGLEEAVEKAKTALEKDAKGNKRKWFRLPTRADDDKGGLVASIRAMLAKGQAEADKNPIKVKTKVDQKKDSDFKLPGWLKAEGGARSAMMPAAFLGLVSLVQPAIEAIGGSLGGLVAMVGSAAGALGVLGGAGGVMGAVIASTQVLGLAFGGLFGKLEKVPKDLVPIRKEFEKLRPEMESFTKAVRSSFWDEWKGDIVSTGKVAMPILSDGLSGIGEMLGRTAKETAAWFRTPLFKSQATDVFKSMKIVTGGFGQALLGSAKGMLNVTQAAGPMLTKVGGLLAKFGVWARGIGDTADEQKRLGSMFEYAWQKGSQLWDMAKNLGLALKDIFSAGQGSGDSLLKSLQDNIKAFREWTKSLEGQDKIEGWFKSVEPIARSAGNLIIGLGAAIMRLTQGSNVAAMLDKITTELVPSLEKFLANLGGTLGPQVVDFITNVLTILTQMSAAGSPLGEGLKFINGFLEKINELLASSPQLASNLGVLLGAFLAFRSLTFFTGIIPVVAKFFGLVRAGGFVSFGASLALFASFAGIIAGWPQPIQAATIALSAFLLMRPKLEAFGKTKFGSNLSGAFGLIGQAAGRSGGSLTKFKSELSGLTYALGYGAGGGAGKGLKGALSMARSGVSGLMGLFGGPWGIAITAAGAALGVWMENEAKAKEIGDALTGTIDKQTGAFTKQSTATVKEALLGDLSAEDIKRVQELGFNFDDLANAALKGGPDLENAKQKLDDIAGIDWLFVKDDADIMEGLAGSMDRAGEGAVRAKVKFDANGAAADAAKPKVNGYEAANRALATATDAAKDAQIRLKAVLLGISDAEVDADDALATYNSTLDAAKANMGTYKVTVDKATGGLDLHSAAGRTNQGVLKGLRTDAIANWQAMLKNGEGADAAKAAMGRARTEFVAIATKMLGSKAAAEAMAAEYGYTTETVDGLSDAIGDVPKQKKVQITAETAVAKAAILAAKAVLNSVHDKTVTLTTIFRNVGHQGALTAHNERQLDRKGLDRKDGGIVEFFANGGIRDGLKAFARGTENHLAEIANAGDWRVWAEPETGGEAYIPLAQAKRGRSMAILEDVAERFGMALAPLGVGAGNSALAPAGGLAAAGSGGSGSSREVNFHPGSITINNPAPEPGSRSMVSTLRTVGEFGLFGEDE